MDCLHVCTASVRCPPIGLFRGDSKRFDPEEELLDELPTLRLLAVIWTSPLTALALASSQGGEVGLSMG